MSYASTSTCGALTKADQTLVRVRQVIPHISGVCRGTGPKGALHRLRLGGAHNPARRGKCRAGGVENYAVTQFVQGTKTRRWAVGWSFGPRRPRARACRGFEPAAGKKLLPPPTESTAAAKTVPEGRAEQTANTFWTQLENVTEGLDLASWALDEERLRGVGFADGNVWSRTYRRRKGREAALAKDAKAVPPGAAAAAAEADDGHEKDVAGCALGFSITIQTLRGEGPRGQARVVAVVRWLQGSDYGLFESFCGMVRNAFAVL